MISVNAVWDDAVAFIRREARLLVPLVLATVMVSATGITLISRAMPPGTLVPALLLLIIGFGIWSLIGELAITALALRPGITVGEALGLALRRLGSVIAIGIIFAVCFVLAILPLGIGLSLSGLDPAKLQSGAVVVPAWASVYLIGLLVAVGWLGVRLCALRALIVDRNPPIVTALRTAFAMTSGQALRLLLPLLLFGIVSLVLSLAVTYVFGTLGYVIGLGLGSPFSGAVVAAMASGLVSAGLQLVVSVFVAFLYRRLRIGS